MWSAECSQAREVMVKDETRRPLWATCTSGKAPPPSVYQKEFQDQLMPGQLLKEALGLEKKKMSDMGRSRTARQTTTRRLRSSGDTQPEFGSTGLNQDEYPTVSFDHRVGTDEQLPKRTLSEFAVVP
jgi:hypothetical protein